MKSFLTLVAAVLVAGFVARQISGSMLRGLPASGPERAAPPNLPFEGYIPAPTSNTAGGIWG